MENNCKCECLRVMTRKERYEDFRKKVSTIEEKLIIADSVGDIIKSINQLETLMEHARKDIQLREVRGYVEDILGTIRAVKMRDSTRQELLKLLEVIVERCDETIALEIHNDQVNRVRWFFQQCAEHAEELSDFIDFSQLITE